MKLLDVRIKKNNDNTVICSAKKLIKYLWGKHSLKVLLLDEYFKPDGRRFYLPPMIRNSFPKSDFFSLCEESFLVKYHSHTEISRGILFLACVDYLVNLICRESDIPPIPPPNMSLFNCQIGKITFNSQKFMSVKIPPCVADVILINRKYGKLLDSLFVKWFIGEDLTEPRRTLATGISIKLRRLVVYFEN